MVILRFLEETEEPIIDDSRQLRVLKECNLVYELYLIVRLFRTVTSHSHIHKESSKIGLGNLVQKFAVLCLIEIFDQNDLLGIGAAWRVCVALLGG